MIPAHLEFLRVRPLCTTFGDYFFVHAGARPGVPLHVQKEHDLIWIREEFLPSSFRFEKRLCMAIRRSMCPIFAATASTSTPAPLMAAP